MFGFANFSSLKYLYIHIQTIAFISHLLPSYRHWAEPDLFSFNKLAHCHKSTIKLCDNAESQHASRKTRAFPCEPMVTARPAGAAKSSAEVGRGWGGSWEWQGRDWDRIGLLMYQLPSVFTLTLRCTLMSIISQSRHFSGPDQLLFTEGNQLRLAKDFVCSSLHTSRIASDPDWITRQRTQEGMYTLMVKNHPEESWLQSTSGELLWRLTINKKRQIKGGDYFMYSSIVLHRQHTEQNMEETQDINRTTLHRKQAELLSQHNLTNLAK